MYSAGGNEIFGVKMTSGINRVSTASFSCLVDCWDVGDEVVIERGDYDVFRGIVQKKNGQNGVWTYKLSGVADELKNDIYTSQAMYIQDFNEAASIFELTDNKCVWSYSSNDIKEDSIIQIGGLEGRTGKSCLMIKYSPDTGNPYIMPFYGIHMDPQLLEHMEINFAFKVKEASYSSVTNYQIKYESSGFKLYFKFDATSNKVSMSDDDSTYMDIGNVGDWIHVKMIFDYDIAHGTGDCDVYIDGVFKIHASGYFSAYYPMYPNYSPHWLTATNTKPFTFLFDSLKHNGYGLVNFETPYVEWIWVYQKLSEIINDILENTSWDIGSDVIDSTIDVSLIFNSKLAALVKVLYEQGGYYGMMFDGIERKVWLEEMFGSDE